MVDTLINNIFGAVVVGRRNCYSYTISDRNIPEIQISKRARDTTVYYRDTVRIPFYRNVRHTHAINLSRTTV